MDEFYCSIDVESDGPIPFLYSMLSLGACCFDQEGNELGAFQVNLELLPGAHQDHGTMRWWAEQPEEVWEAARENTRDPVEGMQAFCSFVRDMRALAHDAKPVAVCYPAGYDWTFCYPYLIRYAGQSPFGFSCLDIKSYAAAVLGLPYRETHKKTMPQEWFRGLPPHTHRAVDDAREQGRLFLNIRKWDEKRNTTP